MAKRFMSLWFPRLKADWKTLRQPELAEIPFVLAMPDHNRIIITALNARAEKEGLSLGMRVADAKAMVPSLQVINDQEGREARLLKAIGEWCIRYSPAIAVDLPDGLLLEVTGCCHIWGGESAYVEEIVNRFKGKGYTVQAAIADTTGAAWAVARFATGQRIIAIQSHQAALQPLPPAALRLDAVVLEQSHKLGFHQISLLMQVPRRELRRRFGDALNLRLMQALGEVDEYLKLIAEPQPYQERLPSLEPIKTRTGIEIAVRELLERLMHRLSAEGKGIRTARLTTYRLDGQIQEISIGTNAATYQTEHLYKLFDLRIGEIEPDLGIELFVLDVLKVEAVSIPQQVIWKGKPGLEDQSVTELLDRLACRAGAQAIQRYLPQEHYWPERSVQNTENVKVKPQSPWRTDADRPTLLLPAPHLIEVSAPIPDYAPILFRYLDKVHYVERSDGPERIEREWWLEAGEHRDNFVLEDKEGFRYWVFRSGHYGGEQTRWYLHGFFA